MALPSLDDYFPDWKEREALAEAMIPLIGKLYRKNVVVYCYGRALYNQSVTQLMKAHRYVRQLAQNELSEFETYPILVAMSELDLGPCHVDVGKMASTLIERSIKDEAEIKQYVQEQCAKVVGVTTPPLAAPQDIVLFGFGRIGRLLARLLIEKTGGGTQLRLRAIVVRRSGANDLAKRAGLLRRDSVHGSFQGTLRVDEENECIIANGNVIRVIYADGPDKVDYTSYGINNAIIIDNTGAWSDEEGLSQHLKSKGAARVILTAPGKGGIKNIVAGINHRDIEPEDAVLAAASCTTNAIVPVLKAVNDRFGIVNGHMETVHAYTNDQNLIDNYHKGSRRGRSAALNMVLTETGAAKAVVKAVPELEGKLTGNAVRVPIPNVSMAIMNLSLSQATSKDEVNEFLRDIALHSQLQNQISYTQSPDAVSSDFVGTREAGIVDSNATIVQDNHCVLYLWYDNEFGYCCQVARMVYKMAGLKFQVYPQDDQGPL